MCGRVTVKTSGKELQREFNLASADALEPRYNVAPTQLIPAILGAPGPRRLELVRWGLIPSWASDPRIGSKLINARAETLAEKPAFKLALQERRCLVVADGFYEWRRDGKARHPFHIQRKGGRPFAMAGLWDEWRPPNGAVVRSCTIITTPPNPLLATIHDRMPLILIDGELDAWLAAGRAPTSLLRTSRVDDLELFAVAPKVNGVDYDAPDCLERVEPPAAPLDLFAGLSLPGVAPRG